MKKYILIVLLFVVFACKTKHYVLGGDIDANLNSNEIVANYYKNKYDFSTLYIKANVRYKDKKQTQNVVAEIRIKKDKAILVSVKFFGITMAKALITPKKVKYYEKIGKNYFEGDCATLSRWLGSELDFYKVQNILLGKSIDNLKKGKYNSIIENELYKLESKSAGNTNKLFYFQAGSFLIKKQEIKQINPQRGLTVSYLNHKLYPHAILPVTLLIEGAQEEERENTIIKMEYTTIAFDEKFSFPYVVPEGYKKIFID